MIRPRYLLVALLPLLLALACSGGQSRQATGSPASPTTARPAVTSGASPAASPAAAASPTAIASGNLLEIENESATAVVVPDAALGAAYAVTTAGLYQLEDRGRWERVGASEPEKTLIADPRQPSTLYRGGHAPCAKGGPPVAFEKSTDGGRSWRVIPSGENVQPLLTPIDQPDVVYGERCLLAISTDGGESWQSYQNVPGFTVASLALRGTQLFGIYSSEGGTSRLIPTDVSRPEQPRAGASLLEFWGGGVVVAGRSQLLVGSAEGVRVSQDGGRTWDLNRRGLENVTVSVNPLTEPIPSSELAGRFGVLTLAVQPKNESHIFAGTVRGLYLSEDGGRSWGLIHEIGRVEVRGLTFAFDGDQLYVQTSQGVAVIKNP